MKFWFSLVFIALIFSFALADDAEEHYQKGVDLFSKVKLVEAKREFEAARKIDPNFAKAYEGLGSIELKKKTFRSAKKYFNKALELDSNSTQALLGLAQISILQKKEFEALPYLKKSVLIDSTKYSAYLLLGRVYFKLEQFGRAYNAYKTASKLSPRSLEAQLKLKQLQDFAGFSEVDLLSSEDFDIESYLKKIEGKSRVTRSDFAIALAGTFDIRELVKEKYLKKRIFSDSLAIDLGSRFRSNYLIKPLLEFQILELAPDGTFGRDEAITKGELALGIQNFLVKIYDNPSLSSQYLDGTQVFPDVPTSHYCYNAVFLVTSRGILSANFDGVFGVNSTFDGKLLMQTIQNLKRNIELASN